MQLSAAEMFFFVPIPTRAKNAWSSSTCLLYGARDKWPWLRPCLFYCGRNRRKLQSARVNSRVELVMRMEQNLVEIRSNFNLIRINRYLLHLDLGFWVKGLFKKYILLWHRYIVMYSGQG